MARERHADDAVFRPRKFSITIDDPEEAEQFLRGLIIARSNNSSPYFEQLIQAVNSIMEPYRQAIIEAQARTIPSSAQRVRVE